MKVPTPDMTKLDGTIQVLGSLHEHRAANPTCKTDLMYYQLLHRYYSDIRNAVDEGKPLVAHTVTLPMEILYALDVVPYLTEVVAMCQTHLQNLYEESLSAAKAFGLTPEICSAHRILLGNILKGWVPRPTAAIWSNLVCDNTAKSSQVISEMYGTPGYFLDRAYAFSEPEVKYFTRELEDMITFLEQATGRKMNWDRLSEAVARSQEIFDLQEEIAEIRKSIPSPIRNRGSMLQHLISFYLPGWPEAVDFFRMMRDEVKETAEQSKGYTQKENFRLAMYYEPPMWGWKILDWMERAHGAAIVTEPCWNYWGDMELNTSNPLEALARKTFARPVCWQFNGPAENIARDMVRGSREYRAEGAFTFCHVGCRQSCAVNRMVSDALSQDLEIPFFSIDCDFGDPTITPMGEVQERLESFFEILEDRK
ncbi:MAG: 2-hydroxyacyl-CoA dehydratase family protein [Dehalococcoidia bacterium]|nr:2-hydroxyacyl-CoA dehydratase family protein [Dehalococcoidia bacterium]